MKPFFGICLAILATAVADNSSEGHKFISQPLTVQATVGQKVLLPCDYEADSVHAPVLRLWFFEKSVLFVDNTPLFRREYFNLVGNSLEVTVIGPEAAGEFICRLSDKNESALTHHIELLGAPKLETDLDEFKAKEGGSITIHCKSSSAPKPNITYTKDGSDVDLTPFVKDGVLQINNATRQNAGVYTCTARNGYEPDAVKKITVNYVGRPDVNVTVQWLNLHDEQNKGVEITCKYVSEEETQISWRKGTSEDVRSSLHYEITKNDNFSVLRIVNIDKKLFDNYTCVATNAHGTESGTVEISSVPIKPTITVAASDVKANVVVSTVSPYRVRFFEVTLKAKVGEPRVIELAVPENEIAGADGKYEFNGLLDNLTPNSDYEATVVAITDKDDRSAPERINFHTQPTPQVSATASINAVCAFIIASATVALLRA